MKPRISPLLQDNTHRLIPTIISDESVFSRLANDEPGVDNLFELESATNGGLLGEANLLPGISVHELLFGVSCAHVVNAAYTYAHPAGGRFNGPDRGAWYASFELKTAKAEVVFHKSQELQEIGWNETKHLLSTTTWRIFAVSFMISGAVRRSPDISIRIAMRLHSRSH